MDSLRPIEHFKSILQLPFIIIIVVPSILTKYTNYNRYIDMTTINASIRMFIGVGLLIMGLVFIYQTIRLFHSIGNGTLAPWNPTQNMVIKGLYQHVRNPMLIGVNLILLAQSLLIPSGNIFIFMLFFLALNTIYFIVSEEPQLEERFGEEYKIYKQNVPRWIPRIKPWYPL